MKQVKKQYQNENFYFNILNLLENGLNLKQISNRLNITKQALNYYIKQLKENNNIQKVGYGTWQVISKEVKKDTMYGKSIRSHAFRFKLIPKQEIYFKILKTLPSKNIEFKQVGINKKTISFKFKKQTIWVCSNNTIDIIFRSGESFYSNSAKQGYSKAFYKALNLAYSLQNKLNIDLSYWKGNFKLKVLKQHYSLIKNELASELRNRGVNYVEIKDNLGIIWCLCDNSFNLEELEAVHNRTGIRDTDRVLSPFMNTLRENPKVLNDLIETARLNTLMLKSLQEQVILLTKLNRKE